MVTTYWQAAEKYYIEPVSDQGPTHWPVDNNIGQSKKPYITLSMVTTELQEGSSSCKFWNKNLLLSQLFWVSMNTKNNTLL